MENQIRTTSNSSSGLTHKTEPPPLEVIVKTLINREFVSLRAYIKGEISLEQATSGWQRSQAILAKVGYSLTVVSNPLCVIATKLSLSTVPISLATTFCNYCYRELGDKLCCNAWWCRLCHHNHRREAHYEN